MEITAGDVFKIDLGDGKPAHYWIVLNHPRNGDEIALISWTYALNVPVITDVWELGAIICPEFSLSKRSVLFVAKAIIRNVTWISEIGANYIGRAPAEVLQRARCNLYWFDPFLRPGVKQFAQWYAVEWQPPCGPGPGVRI